MPFDEGMGRAQAFAEHALVVNRDFVSQPRLSKYISYFHEIVHIILDNTYMGVTFA